MTARVIQEGDNRTPWWEIVVDSVVELRSSCTTREIGEQIQERLNEAGYSILGADGTEAVDDEVAPEWATVLLDSLFTGARLDFGGTVIPSWLQRRLEAEYGMPVPTGDQATRPAGPLDIDEEEQSDLDTDLIDRGSQLQSDEDSATGSPFTGGTLEHDELP